MAPRLMLLALVSSGCTGAVLVPATVDQDRSLPSLSVRVAGRDRLVHVESFGEPDAPLLLMLHGSLADHRALLPFQVLADRYHVVMWDQRGNGLSERVTAGEYGWDSIVEEIDAIRDHYGPGEPVTLIGHSFGAMYAALYLSRRGEEVHQVVMLEPGGLDGEIFSETYADIISIDLLARGLNRAFWQSEVLSPADHEAVDYKSLRLLLDGHTTRYHCDPDAPVPIPVWRPGGHVEYLRGEAMAARGAARPTFDFDFTEGLADWQGSALFVAGECSALGPDFQEKWHLPLFQDAQLVSVPDAGHRLFVEQWDAVIAPIQAFLDPP
jgi:proline iminopeptidase